jgi:L-threonylcarbamoyladenylate synthase
MSQLLSISNTSNLEYAAKMIAQGNIVAAAFNGIFGLFGDADAPEAMSKIIDIKERPENKNLILVSAPEFLPEHLDLAAPAFHFHPLDKLQQLYRDVHALGMRLPAAIPGAPPHLVLSKSIVNIWTEYPPHYAIRQLIIALRQHGKRALVGTSANKSGLPTFTRTQQLVDAFGDELLILADDFAHLPAIRRISTTIVDFTGEFPRLFRKGNVPEEELRVHLKRLGLHDLVSN